MSHNNIITPIVTVVVQGGGYFNKEDHSPSLITLNTKKQLSSRLKKSS